MFLIVFTINSNHIMIAIFPILLMYFKGKGF